jgi:hypothetical protein
MGKSEMISILKGLSSKSHLDNHVVGVLESNYDEIVASRVHKQNEARGSYEQKFQANIN